jgi:hypothetical protein
MGFQDGVTPYCIPHLVASETFSKSCQMGYQNGVSPILIPLSVAVWGTPHIVAPRFAAILIIRWVSLPHFAIYCVFFFKVMLTYN